jgi:hypothetical protein
MNITDIKKDPLQNDKIDNMNTYMKRDYILMWYVPKLYS